MVLHRSAEPGIAEALDAAASPPRRLLVGLSLVSAAALAYEILLTRLFSIIQWHHFAYMMISVALLGYGAAGAAVTLTRERIMPRLALSGPRRRQRSTSSLP